MPSLRGQGHCAHDPASLNRNHMSLNGLSAGYEKPGLQYLQHSICSGFSFLETAGTLVKRDGEQAETEHLVG